MFLLSKNDGFVLIEALAAVVIIAISLTLIMESFIGSFRSTTIFQDTAKALILAENRLGHVFAVPMQDRYMPDGPCPAPLDRFHYKSRIDSIDEQEMPGLKRFDLTVSWPKGSKNKEMSLTTWLTGENVQQKTQTRFYN